VDKIGDITESSLVASIQHIKKKSTGFRLCDEQERRVLILALVSIKK